MSIPVSLASLSLVQDAATKFASSFSEMIYRMRNIERQLTSVKRVYEVVNIPNVLSDGTIPFPEDASQIRSGVALEFRWERHEYPETYAIDQALQERLLQISRGGAVCSPEHLV